MSAFHSRAKPSKALEAGANMIPKKEGADCNIALKTISLIGSVYKILSKLKGAGWKIAESVTGCYFMSSRNLRARPPNFRRILIATKQLESLKIT